jgi:hypothetical protein
MNWPTTYSIKINNQDNGTGWILRITKFMFWVLPVRKHESTHNSALEAMKYATNTITAWKGIA